MFSCSADSTIRVYEMGTDGKFSFVLNISGYHELPIYSVDYSTKLGVLVSAGGDDSLIFYSIAKSENGELEANLIEKKVKSIIFF